jgi:hypothetical protein
MRRNADSRLTTVTKFPAGILNEDDCPFTEAELRLALTLAYPPEEAERFARRTAEGARTMYARAQFEADLAAGTRGSRISCEFMVLPDFIFALLTLSDREVAARFHEWQTAMSERSRAGRELQAMHRAGLDTRGPVAPEVSAQLDAEDSTHRQEWERVLMEARQLLALPIEERYAKTRGGLDGTRRSSRGP